MEPKKKILFVNYNMIVGGSTTSLLSLLNCIDKNHYEVFLQLYKNEGPLLPLIPDGIQLLPEASRFGGKIGTVRKYLRFLFSEFLLRSYHANRKIGKKGFSQQVMSDFQVQCLSRSSDDFYDFAVGFLEGWADRYVAFCVCAAKKYGWLHAEFDRIAPVPELELLWMNKMDKIVNVADKCDKDFKDAFPDLATKAVFCENIMDSGIVRRQAKNSDWTDSDYIALNKETRFRIITVCRLDIRTKGLDRAVHCAAQLKKDGYRFFWVIVGDGADRAQLEQLIWEKDIADCFHPIGARTNPYPLISLCDIFCMPSRWEGKPISVTESMILGVPPVVTEYRSAKEQIFDGVDGLIARNDDNTIIEKVRYCIDNPQKVAEMKQYLFEHEYGNREIVSEIESVLF
jgi:glycosyltransferase involved in cell wall biosynthesis